MDDDEITRAADEAKKTPWLKRTKDQRKAIQAYDLRELKRSWGEAKEAVSEAREAMPTEKPASHVRARFEGAVLDGTKGVVSYKGTTVPLPATARVETAGEIQRRVTVTRLVAVGVFAFALKKKKDSRELYLTVEGDGAAFVMELNPKMGHKAREFAAQVNSAA